MSTLKALDLNALARTVCATIVLLGLLLLAHSCTESAIQKKVDDEMARVCPCFEAAGIRATLRQAPAGDDPTP